jgi:hypothetical protein
MITLAEVVDMKPKEVSYHKVEDLSPEAFEYVHDRFDMNCCDKCGQMCLRNELTWIEDGMDYDALCELCLPEGEDNVEEN